MHGIQVCRLHRLTAPGAKRPQRSEHGVSPTTASQDASAQRVNRGPRRAAVPLSSAFVQKRQPAPAMTGVATETACTAPALRAGAAVPEKDRPAGHHLI
jgi:hypothetical protein